MNEIELLASSWEGDAKRQRFVELNQEENQWKWREEVS